MREIKFRAWDKYDGKIRDWEDLCRSNSQWFKTVMMGLDQDLILEQFTGLHDKNGKEIYEGDICELHQHTDVYAVEWDEHYHALIFKGKFSWERRNLTKEFKAKIIGNIHENPELLEAK